LLAVWPRERFGLQSNRVRICIGKWHNGEAPDTLPVWTNGKDTRFRKIESSETFTNVRVRTVPVSEVHP
jgi:hypothetical protein